MKGFGFRGEGRAHSLLLNKLYILDMILFCMDKKEKSKKGKKGKDVKKEDSKKKDVCEFC